MDQTGNKDIIERFYALVQEIFEWASGKTMKMADATEKADFDVDLGATLGYCLLTLFLLGSAFWAASIASARRHHPLPHFLLGLLLPWVYPLIILFVMDIEGERERKKELARKQAEEEAAEAQRLHDIALNRGRQAVEEKPAESPDGFNQAFCKNIARNKDGSLCGPFDVLFNGIAVHVLFINDALPQVVQVTCIDEKGRTSQIRIPYQRIEAWEPSAMTEKDREAIQALTTLPQE